MPVGRASSAPGEARPATLSGPGGPMLGDTQRDSVVEAVTAQWSR